MLRMPSGFPSLDKATAGGLPAGCFVEIVGAAGTGKSELAVVYMAMQQLIWGDRCALAAGMTEFHFDKLYAKRRGLRVELADEEIASMERAEKSKFDDDEIAYLKDKVGEFVEAYAPVAEDVWELVLRMLGSRLFHIILLDSLGALMTAAEEEGAMSDKQYGGAAAVNTKAFHKFHGLMSLEEDGIPNSTLIIGINQIRDKLDAAAWDNDPKVGGGNAKDHGKSACILLEWAGWIRDKDVVSKPKIGKYIRWRILKGKHGFPEGAQGQLQYLYSVGFDRAADILDESIVHGYIRKSGSWFSIAKDIKDPDEEGKLLAEKDKRIGQGHKKACDFLRNRDHLMDALYDLIMEDAGIRVNFT